ncbi:MAG: type II toxin-antitoxin system RelE/ParE family toxin [Candidatus Brocadiales bacterium]|nr:type II toxin-antitoxin system RelE/ParE family toxin [Candidatus Brocadiales bacterium]
MYKVYFTKEAEKDLEGVYRFLDENDSKAIADLILDKIEESCDKLGQFPDRGHFPPELKRISIFEFREIHCKPFRIIYQVISKNVFIHCVLDQRREISDLLHDRLIRPNAP